MKGFKMIFAETKRFYLMVFLFAILYVVLDCVYISNENKMAAVDADKLIRIEESLTTEDALTVYTNNVVSLADDISSKLPEVMWFLLTMILISVALFIREFVFTDSRTREFRQTWPIKNWVRELYHYFMMLGIIMIAFGIQALILQMAQSRYNHLLADVLSDKVNLSDVDVIIASGNKELLIVMASSYILPVVANYTWIYLGMTLARNPIVGAVLSLVMKVCLAFLSCTLIENIVDMSANDILHHIDISEILYCFFWDGDITYYYSGWLSILKGSEIVSYEDALFVNVWIWLKVISIILFIICIAIVAKKKELSKGRLFYFPILDVPFSIIIGLCVFVCMMEELIYWIVEFVPGVEWFAVSGCMILPVVIYLFIHPISMKRAERLEVK